jgi:hypothetical protein
MHLTEWKSAKDWTPYCVSKFRWLVVHHGDKEDYQFNYWSDKEDEEESDCEDKSDLQKLPEQVNQEKDCTKKFGPLS